MFPAGILKKAKPLLGRWHWTLGDHTRQPARDLHKKMTTHLELQ